jgi:hypothetical protein
VLFYGDMTPNDAFVLATHLALGFSLAATCGLRAFLPLLAAGILARMGYVVVAPHFLWLGSTPALVCFGSAVLIEVIGDKFPAVDHALDAAGLVVKPLAATLLSAAMFTHVDPVLACVLGLATGGAMAGGVHVVKAKTRLASTLFTAGFGNPVLSILEDIAAFISIALAVLVPLLAAFILFMTVVFSLFLIAQVRTRRAAARTSAPTVTA